MRNSNTQLSKIVSPWGFLCRFSQRASYPLLRDVALLLCIAAFGGMAALLVIEPWKGVAVPLEAMLVDGISLPTGDPRPEQLVRMARERLQNQVTLVGPDLSKTFTWAVMGASVDLDGLGRLLEELAVEDSPAAQYNRDEADVPGVAEVALPVSLDSDAAVESLVALKDVIDRKPSDARFDFAAKTIKPEADGRSLDVYETLARLDDALAKGADRVEIAIRSVSPEVTVDELSGIDVGAVAGFYETPYSRMRKDRDRTHNVKLGASILDGHIIMPGQQFSFNKVLGDRSEARGFRYAPVIAGGAIVEGMGGGTCQVASTLYAASFFAGMLVEERQPHSRPSSYIKLGLDATVSYPTIDLKMRNPYEYPVAIHFTVDGGKARVEIRAKERPYTVTLLRKIVGTRPFPVRTIDDSSLARGKDVITQRGVPGYTVQRYKVIERDKVSFRFQSTDRYPPTTEFVHRGTADPATLAASKKTPPKEDTHKPYRASASLRMVQGASDWYESTHD